MSAFGAWLDAFLEEKGIPGDEVLEVEGPSGANWIPVACLVEMMKGAPNHETRAIKSTCVKIDFVNGNVRHYLKHLARAVAR